LKDRRFVVEKTSRGFMGNWVRGKLLGELRGGESEPSKKNIECVC